MATDQADEEVDLLDSFRQFFALERDVLVLSLSMLAFSLAFQMTSRYLPEYMRILGASAGVIGLYGSVGNLISAVYPYPGGAVSDRLGSRFALTAFAVLATLGFGVWYLAAVVGTVAVGAHRRSPAGWPGRGGRSPENSVRWYCSMSPQTSAISSSVRVGSSMVCTAVVPRD